MVGLPGIELGTFDVSDQCSNQLSYSPIKLVEHIGTDPMVCRLQIYGFPIKLMPHIFKKFQIDFFSIEGRIVFCC